MSRGIAGVCVVLAFALGAAIALLFGDDDVTPKEKTVTVSRRAAAAPTRTSRRAPVPRSFSAGPVELQRMVPSDAAVMDAWRSSRRAAGVPAQVVVTWARPRTASSDDDHDEYGLALWQAEGYGRWRQLYGFHAPPFPREGDVYGISVRVQDVSGDGVGDVLSYEDHDGSGGVGVYRLVVTAKGAAREVFRRENSFDSETIGMRDGAVIVDRGIRGSEGRPPPSAHPDYTRWRRTSYRWDGRRLVAGPSRVVGNQRHIGPLGW
jgi:hypothetical protein